MDNYLYSDPAGTVPRDFVQALVDTMPVGIEVLKSVRRNNSITDFEYVLVNKVASERIGQDVVGKQLGDLKTSPSRTKRMIDVVETGKYFISTVKGEVNGSIRWFNEKYEKLNDGVVIYTEDTTSQVKSDFHRAEDIHFADQIADLNPDIVYIMDLNTMQVVYNNRSIATTLGYTKAQVATMKNPLFDIMHEEDVPRMLAHIEQLKATTPDGKIVEIEYRMKQARGGYRWFCDRNAVFKRNKSRVPVEKMGISQDITDRKEQEAERQTSHDIILQAEIIADLGAWDYDLSTQLFRWTEGMYRLFNLPQGDPVTPGIYLDYTPARDRDRAHRVIDHIVFGLGPFEETLSLLPANQEEKTIRIQGIVQKDKSGKPLKVIGVDMDTTREIKAMKEIKALNSMLFTRNDELNELNGEIRALNELVVRDYKDTIKQLYLHLENIISNEAGRLSDSGRANIRRSQAAIQKMNLLTDDINNYFQLYDTTFEPGPVDTMVLVREVIATFHDRLQECNGSVECDTLPVLISHPVLFTRLLSHLVGNSIKFRSLVTPLVIRIHHSMAEKLNGKPGAFSETPYDIISVSDNGLGYDNAESEKIFWLFYRAVGNKTKGSGIGLAICRKIMKMHNGFITGEGQPDRGATFNCHFPVRKQGEQG